VRRGSAPESAVLVTAHYDHLGMREMVGDGAGDRIFNGAVDNASGVAGVLAMASAWAAAPQPRRSIYIALTTAEEAGLLGAEHLATRLPLPTSAWAAEVNVDEVNVFGPTSDLVLLGLERSAVGRQAQVIAARRGRRVVPDPEPGQGNFFRSDHFPFAKRGVPALSLGLATRFTGSDAEGARRRRDEFSERRYHQVTDEVRDDWDLDAAVADLRLLAEIVWGLANAEVGSEQ
jgi:Zn-dependent M28 family amino/carboxypeptidase